MSQPVQILIADDEETFRLATADLLRKEGYTCDVASDAQSAAEKLKHQEYDLLIADIKMPGNPNLELVRNLPRLAPGMPVILVTAYPSLRSAIQSIQLPVVAYLIKPVDLPELLEWVRKAVASSRVFRAVRTATQRLSDWQKDLAGFEQVLTQSPPRGTGAPREAFADLTFRNIIGALSDLQNLMRPQPAGETAALPCHLFNCPKLTALTAGVSEAIDVLEQTKTAFKSKDIGELRKKLETLIQRLDHPQADS